MEIVTSEEMRRIDRHAIRSMRIPTLALMEAAGLRVIEAIARHFPDLEHRRVLVLCGKGNNGGDGLVVARHLHVAGVDCAVALAADMDDLSGDAHTNLLAARGAGVTVHLVGTPALWTALRRRLTDRNLFVDALLGTGLSGPARGIFAKIIADLSRTEVPIVAVDIPSGLSGDSAEPPGPALRAALTVALCRPKLAHLLPPACFNVGLLEVVDIGIPPAAVSAVGPKVFSIEPNDMRGFLPKRVRSAHKGAFGHALVIAGGVGRAGAAALAGQAALRAGAGLVTVAVPEAVRTEVASFAPEIMTSAIPSGPPDATLDKLLAESAGKSALALGPGLGRDASVVNWIRRFVAASRLPLVLDADGLNAFEGKASALASPGRTLVLTPHAGEMARLTGATAQEVVRDRLASARALARTARAIVVLKGMATLVAAPDGRVFVNRTGNAGMATAGSGDVLTGLLAALLGRRLDPLRTVVFGVHLHGRAGDLAAASRGQEGLIARDILDHLPAALLETST